MCDPHPRGQFFTADVAEREHETRARLFDTEKISGQVTNCEDLARDVECPISHQTRSTQSTMNLCGLEDGGVQLRVIALQSFELQFEFSRWRTFRKGSFDCACRAGECCGSHDPKTSAYKLVA